MITGRCKTFRESDVASTHPLGASERVTVFHLEILKRPLIEGRAEIIAPVMRAAHLYKVRFEGEQHQFVRFVHPGDWQSAPDAQLATLLAFWRATLAPDILMNLDRDRF